MSKRPISARSQSADLSPMSFCGQKVSFVFSLLLPLVCASCAFADLRPIGIRTVPEKPWALLSDAESPVIIRFDSEMEKASVERAFQVYSQAGIAEGELSWEGRNLYFAPAIPWKAGIRYALKLSGTVAARDGRELPLSLDIPFYAISRSPLPYVKDFSPFDGASTGVSGSVLSGVSGYMMLELDFSHPMDSRSSEEALKFDIPGEKQFEWLDDCKTLRVSSDKPLNPWTVYKWSISEKALSREGAPLAKEFGGRFITDLERKFLEVVRVVPLLAGEPLPLSPAPAPGNKLWGSWTPASLNPEQGPGFGQGIGVEFNKAPDIDSLKTAFSFVPPLPGMVEVLSPVSAVFIPSKNLEPETVYSMRISGALKDSEGLKMGNDYSVVFKTDVPFLHVNSISFIHGEEKTAPGTGSLISVKVAPGGIIRYVIHFSLLFDPGKPAVREEAVFRITLRPFFPATLPPVSLRSAQWISSDRLLMEWEGPEGGLPGEAHFYRLFIPGGSGGLHNGLGSYFKEDFILFLEVEA